MDTPWGQRSTPIKVRSERRQPKFAVCIANYRGGMWKDTTVEISGAGGSSCPENRRAVVHHARFYPSGKLEATQAKRFINLTFCLMCKIIGLFTAEHKQS